MNQLIASILLDFSLDLYEPIFNRDLDLGEPRTPRAGNLVTVVSGIRRCGKSYRLFQEIKRLLNLGISPDRILYFNFDDDRLDLTNTQVGDEVLTTFYELHPDALTTGAYLFLDEIQEMAGWDTWMRRIVDTRKATIYITGSSSKLLSTEIASAFRGRSLVFEMSPLSFSEYVRFHLPDVDTARGVLGGNDRLRVRPLFDRYLVSGGFPAVQQLPEPQRIMTLQSYARQVVTRDVIERHNLGNPRALFGFSQRLLSMSGRELSLRKVEGDLRSQGTPIGREKLGDVLGFLEDAFLVATVREFSKALAEEGRAIPKVYAADPGLVFANSKAAVQDVGQRLETAVYLELRRRNAFGRQETIGLGRTREHRYEIDFVGGDAVTGTGIELFQVCMELTNQKTRQRELRALQEAMSERDCPTSWLLTMAGEREDITVPEGTIHQRPAWEWCLGLS